MITESLGPTDYPASPFIPAHERDLGFGSDLSVGISRIHAFERK